MQLPKIDRHLEVKLECVNKFKVLCDLTLLPYFQNFSWLP